MERQDFQCGFIADVAPQQGIDAIARVSEWWAKDFEGAAQQPGDVFTVRFGATWVTFRVAEVIGDAKVIWQVVDCNLHWLADKQEWLGTLIEWDLAARNGAIEIGLTHVGLVPEIECYEQCRKGWTFFVTESLRKLLTEGRGLPE